MQVRKKIVCGKTETQKELFAAGSAYQKNFACEN